MIIGLPIPVAKKVFRIMFETGKPVKEVLKETEVGWEWYNDQIIEKLKERLQ